MAREQSSPPKRSFQNPKGTRDFYPADLLRQRYITDCWRRVALRHGFDEIDGPTFEHLDLYTVKSGPGIVSELFSFRRAGGDDDYALRPEFTPTLARMYAARARQLPKPVKWFSICNYFRAEKPQRGRLREFLQLNCDVIGLGGGEATTEDTEGKKAEADGELMVVLASLLGELGLTPREALVRFNHRGAVERELVFNWQVASERLDAALELLDRAHRMSAETVEDAAIHTLNLSPEMASPFAAKMTSQDRTRAIPLTEHRQVMQDSASPLWEWGALYDHLTASSCASWSARDISIVRGLAYYTGTVFEAIAEGERAVAGGGRYDNLIELCGGPPTPAAGFAMGDVVLGNLLDDKGLIPEGREILEALSRPLPVRPDAFVVAANDEASEQIVPLVAKLRRGQEAEDAQEHKAWDPARYSVAPLHTRRSYKATRNVGKLLKEANACHARFAVILESTETCSIKDLDKQAQTGKPVPLADVGKAIASGDLSEWM